MAGETNKDGLEVSSTCKTTSLLAAYETWVGNHKGLARNVETTLYVAPQLIPVILTRLIRVPLSLIMHVQVLAEVVTRKVGGDVGKWRLIVWVETVKGVLRLMLLAQRRRVMLRNGGKYKGEESDPQPSVFARFQKTKQLGARTGKTFGKGSATVSEPEPSTKTSVDKACSKMTFEDATSEVAEASREDLLVAGEVCHILRPVMYALLRHRRSETSWTPVVVALLGALLLCWLQVGRRSRDILPCFVRSGSLALSAAAVKPTEPTKAVFTDKAGDEIAARKVLNASCTDLAIAAEDSLLKGNNMALLLYLLRDPVFATVTKPVAGKTANVLDNVPGVGKLFRFGTTAILDYYHDFYFYTSAS
ncbi:hypothetical protein KXD40_002958 [Peronospora effusa]|uniref:Peroxisomal membrane protein PEX16 n=1 Tax=Peronospora effusa TaxID=542832 RepID=A0A3M6VT91_9STRA|nr:hypothetical protein DD238_003129 [Peronospora effusa]UIZ29624.1 hypothetical protein KXD40_002958 [Peronospora effusa]